MHNLGGPIAMCPCQPTVGGDTVSWRRTVSERPHCQRGYEQLEAGQGFLSTEIERKPDHGDIRGDVRRVPEIRGP
jgi:hypothetical protein